jgi:hypothetical protein
MIDPDSIMVTLSPRLLLEIDLTVQSAEPSWIVREDLPETKFAEFRKPVSTTRSKRSSLAKSGFYWIGSRPRS